MSGKAMQQERQRREKQPPERVRRLSLGEMHGGVVGRRCCWVSGNGEGQRKQSSEPISILQPFLSMNEARPCQACMDRRPWGLYGIHDGERAGPCRKAGFGWEGQSTKVLRQARGAKDAEYEAYTTLADTGCPGVDRLCWRIHPQQDAGSRRQGPRHRLLGTW